MTQQFANNAERIAYLVDVIGKMSATMADAHAVYSSDAEAETRVSSLQRIIAEAGGLRTVGYNLARLGADELEAMRKGAL